MIKTAPLTPSKRIVSIDLMRSIAIMLMVLCHSGIYLSSPTENPGFYFFANHVIGDFPAPFFLFLVGISQAISTAQNSHIKGFILFLFSFVLSFLTSGLGYVFEWDVLSIIGISMMVLYFLKPLNSFYLILISLFFILVTPFLRDTSVLISQYGGSFEWNKYLDVKGFKVLVDPAEEYEPIFSLKKIWIGMLWSGSFPMFPCLAYPLIGFSIGKVFLKSRKKKKIADLLMQTGFLLIAVSAFLVYSAQSKPMMNVATQFISAYSFYPISFSMLLLQFGVTFSLFGFLSKAYDSRSNVPVFYHHYERLSRYSLSIYVLHYLILFWPMRIAGLLHGDYEKYMSNSTSAETSFLIGCLLILMFVSVTKMWDGVGGKYSLEWTLSKIKKTSLSDSPHRVQSLNPDQ
jgi:uncharacterized membrane protein